MYVPHSIIVIAEYIGLAEASKGRLPSPCVTTVPRCTQHAGSGRPAPTLSLPHKSCASEIGSALSERAWAPLSSPDPDGAAATRNGNRPVGDVRSVDATKKARF